jgi:DNA replication initiation complex subunit (GINS family)
MHTAKIPVIPRRNQTIEINGEEYTLQEGKKTELPKWLAEILDVECVTYKSSDIKQILMNERKPTLSELPPNFYERMEFSTDKETQRAFLNLLDVRIEKIAKLSSQFVDVELPHEEQVLYNKMKELIQEWKEGITQRILTTE